MKSPMIDICGIMRNYKDNIFMKHFIRVTDSYAPGLIHECPYTVNRKHPKNGNIKVGLSLQGVNVRNISFKPEAYPAGLPSGDYKYIQTGYYGDETVGSVNIIVNINSPDKESFG